MGQRCTWRAISPNTQKTHTAHTHVLESCIYASHSSRHSTWSRRPSLQEEDGGGGEMQAQRKRRQVRESRRQWWHSVLNVTMVLKIPANLLAGNDMTGGMGGRGVEGKETTSRQRWRGKRSDKEKETKGGRLGQSGWRWSVRWQRWKRWRQTLLISPKRAAIYNKWWWETKWPP